MTGGSDQEKKARSVQSAASVTCSVCLKEVPASAARSVESQDYTRHFCGVRCYDIWQRQQQRT